MFSLRLRNLWRDRRWDLVKFRFRVKDDWLPANVRRRYSLPFHIFGPLGEAPKFCLLVYDIPLPSNTYIHLYTYIPINPR